MEIVGKIDWICIVLLYSSPPFSVPLSVNKVFQIEGLWIICQISCALSLSAVSRLIWLQSRCRAEAHVCSQVRS